MKGLPIQQHSKQVQGSPKTQGIVEGKKGASVEAGEENVEGLSEFSSLFSGMAAADGKKSSAVKSQTGETLKNLLTEKNGKEAAEVLVDGKTVVVANAEPKKSLSVDTSKLTDQKIAKTSSNLDQLLNTLKGTTDSQVTEENSEVKSGKIPNAQPVRKGESHKAELKSESPLDFLMKGAKGKDVGVETPATDKKAEVVQGQVKVMTADDYIKNMQSAEKKSATLTLIKGEAEQNPIAKMMNPNAKTYGQGLNLLSDPLIKNTKDLADKDVKKVKSSLSGIDEILQNKETKVGAELASIKQEVVPGIQNTKNSHGQESQTQTNANQKVLDLSNIQTSNTTEIIKRISDYVEQNQVANKQSLDLTVKHESLGEFKIQVSKMPDSMNRGQNLIDMQITSSSKEGHDFFVKNEVSLMKNLNQAGINLSDLRIVSSMSESSMFGQSDSRQSSSFQQSADGSSKQSMNFESSNFTGSGSEGSERRKELWEEYQERFGA